MDKPGQTPGHITVEVAYALPDNQLVLKLDVAEGITVEEAIRMSGIIEQFPDIDLAKNKVGVFGKISTMDAVLRDRDRVEIYRPLIADPKESRRKRAEKKDQSGKKQQNSTDKQADSN